MKESAKEILDVVRKQFIEMNDRNMRIVNTDHLYAEVVRCIQPIKDKKANIGKLNTKRGNHGHCREGFPLQYEEIQSLCLQIERGLNGLDHLFFMLKYFSPLPEDQTWQDHDINMLKIQSVSDLTKKEEDEIDSFVMALRFILIKQSLLSQC